MAEPSSASDIHAGPPRYHTVFIDTSLDTHIVMLVSDGDTVADLKKKILLEHPLCFSSIGKIKIHSLMVKRKGYFYHLSDSMFVKSAFDGVKGNWFLYVDASSLVELSENQLVCNPDSGNLLLCLPSADGVDLQPDEPSKKLFVYGESSLPKSEVNQSANEKAFSADEFGPGNPIVEHLKVLEMEVKHNSDDNHKTSLVSNKKLDPEENSTLFSGEIESAGTHIKQKKDGNKIVDMQCNVSLEEALKTEPVPKKKQRVKNKQKDALSDRALKEDNAPPIHASGKDTSQKESIILENPVGNAGIEVPNDMRMGNKQVSDDPGEIFSSETSKRSHYGVQKKHDLCEEIQVQGTRVECQDNKPKDTIDVQCNSSVGGISQPKPAAKKKRKIVKKNEPECPPKENEALLPDFNKETSEAKIGSIQHTLENGQKIINSDLDGLPVEPPEPSRLIGTNSSTGKRKRKKKLSNPCSLAVSDIPSEKDARQEGSKATAEVNLRDSDSGRKSDTVIVTGEKIQDATHSTPCALSLKEDKCSDPILVVEIPNLSPGIAMNEDAASNAGRKSDLSEVGGAYEVRRRKGSKKHHAVDGRDLSLKKVNSLRKDLELSEQENVVPGDHLKLRIAQTDKIEGEREISPNNDPIGMLSEKCGLSRCDESNMNMEDANAAAIKRKKSKKAKNAVEETPLRSDMEHAKDPLNGFASIEPHKTFDGNHSSNEADKGEIVFPQIERTEVLTEKVTNTSLLGVDREIDVMSGNERESSHLAHISKTQENIEDMVVDDKVRKKTKKQSSTAKNLPDLQKKKQDVGPEVLASSTCKIKVDAPPKKKKTKAVKTSSTNQFKRSNRILGLLTLLKQDSGSVEDAGTEVESLHPKQDSGTFDSSQIPSAYELENNSVERPPEANVDGNLLKLGCINKANDHKEVSSYQGDMVDVSRHSQHEVVAPTQALADEDTKVKRSGRVSKTNKNKKRSNPHLVGTSCDVQNSSKTSKNQDVETKFEGDNQLQDPLSLGGHSKLMPESDRKSSEISRNDLKSPPSHDIGKFDTIPEEVRWPNVVNASGANSTAHAFSKEHGEASLFTSSSDSSEDRTYPNKRGKRQSNLDRYRVTVRKAPSKNTGEVVNSSDQRKSLLATYGSIFNDGGSESSDGNDGVVNSDASTRTPSDSSASSDYTEGENNQHLDSSHGLHSAKRNESGAKSIGKSNTSESKKVTMDAILRRSSRFKKAKVTASQLELNDTESQPVEFVPDSQPNL